MPDTGAFTLDLEPSVESVRAARHAVEAWAQEVGAHQLVETTTLLVSELATNAVVHGGKPYTITARWQPPLLRVDVIDSSPPPGLNTRRDWGAQEAGGWGLQIINRLAHSWGIEARGDRQAVWFEVEDDTANGQPDARPAYP